MAIRLKIDPAALEIGDVVHVIGRLAGRYPEGGTCVFTAEEAIPCRITKAWEDDETGWRFHGAATTTKGLAFVKAMTRNPDSDVVFFGEDDLIVPARIANAARALLRAVGR